MKGIEGSVLLSSSGPLALGLLQASDKLNKKIPSGAKIIINHIDGYQVHMVNKKIQAKSQVDKLPQSNTNGHTIVHTKQDFMSLFPACFQDLGKFQGEPYHIDVDPSVPPRKKSM